MVYRLRSTISAFVFGSVWMRLWGQVIYCRIIANTIRSLGKRTTTIENGYLRRTKYRIVRKKGEPRVAYGEGIHKRRAEFTRAMLGLFKYYQIRIRLRAELSDPTDPSHLLIEGFETRCSLLAELALGKSGQSLCLSIARRESAGHLFFRITIEDGKKRDKYRWTGYWEE